MSARRLGQQGVGEPNSYCQGQAEAMAILTRRTLTRTQGADLEQLRGTELPAPVPDTLVGHDHAALCGIQLDISQAQAIADA